MYAAQLPIPPTGYLQLASFPLRCLTAGRASRCQAAASARCSSEDSSPLLISGPLSALPISLPGPYPTVTHHTRGLMNLRNCLPKSVVSRSISAVPVTIPPSSAASIPVERSSLAMSP